MPLANTHCNGEKADLGGYAKKKDRRANLFINLSLAMNFETHPTPTPQNILRVAPQPNLIFKWNKKRKQLMSKRSEPWGKVPFDGRAND